MDESIKKEYTVNGYIFGSSEDIELAENEYSTVKYIDKKIENRSADTVLSVYQGAIERKLFRTPVGYGYMHELQKRMVAMGIKRDEIPDIPLYQVYNNRLSEDPRPDRNVVVPRIKKRDALRIKNRNLTIALVILAVMIVALFFIALNADSPNILNYRRTIQNEYASWEQELSAREQVIREKERELNIVYQPENDKDTE